MKNLIQEEINIREKIINDFSTNYLLEAGAGAGKTTIIVDRIINHIIKGDVEPKEIVAITFTKAASLELAGRIQKKALTFMGQDKYSYAKSRLEKVEEIFTGTIHSFCELLLREMPFESGLTPGYEIIEDSSSFYEKIWYEFLREEERENVDLIDRLNSFNIDYRDLKTSAFVAMDNPDVKFTGFDNHKDFKDLEKDFDLLNVKSLKGDIVKKNSNLGKIFNNIIEDKKNLKEYIDLLLMEYPKISEDDDLRTKFIRKNDLKSQQADDLVKFIETVISITKDANAIKYNLSTEFVNKAVAYKRRKYINSLSFNDLLFKASSLIKESSKARDHFKRKFKYFYIDEAQDTDPMQAELIMLLSHKGNIDKVESLEDVQAKDGSLFIVGDPKQSIYRFRRADIIIYEKVKEIISSNGQVVYLDINFRSSDSICSWVEESFKDRSDGFGFAGTSTSIQAGFKKILSLWKTKEEENKLSGVYAYDFIENEEFTEEAYVASMVEDIIKARYIGEKVGRDLTKTRKVENKDIMILTKSNEETGRFLAELKARNIPALLAGEKKLADVPELLKLFLLVDFLADPGDRIKFVALLKNCFNLDFETIDYFLNKEKGDKLYKEEGNYSKHPHIREVIYKLKNIEEEAETLSPMIFVEKIIRDRHGIYDSEKDYNEVEKRDADASLMQALEILKSKKPISIFHLRQELENIIEEKVNYELPIDLEFSRNAVRIMNMHKAKGLESEIVILVGKNKKRNLQGESHYTEKNGNNTLGYISYKRDLFINAPQEEKRKEEEKGFKEAEIDRLIYVAATRAKSVLIMPQVDNEKLFLGPIAKGFVDIIELENTKVYESKTPTSSKKIEELELTRDLTKRAEVSQASYKKKTPSGEDMDFKEEINMELFKDLTTPRGKDYGDMVHKAFEIIFREGWDIKNLAEKDISYAVKVSIREKLKDLLLDDFIIRGLHPGHKYDLENTEDLDSLKEKLAEHLYRDLRKVVDIFINNKDIRDLLAKSKHIFPEFSFTCKVEAELLEEKDRKKDYIVNGLIDLLIQKEDKTFVIIDYKTDIVAEDLAEEIFKDKYKAQLELYKKVIEHVLKDEGVLVEKVLIYSTYTNKLIPIA